MFRSAASRRMGVAMIGVGVAFTMGCSTSGDTPPERDPQPSASPAPNAQDSAAAGAGSTNARSAIFAPSLAVTAVTGNDIGGMTGRSTFTPVAILRDADPDALLLVGNDELDGSTMRRCKRDGSKCTSMALASGSMAGAQFDAASNRILLVGDDAAVRSCNVDGTACTTSTIPGTKPRAVGRVVLDPVSQKVVRRGCAGIERCAPAGGCVPIAALSVASASATECSSNFDFAYDDINQKLVFVSTSSSAATLTRCDVGGTTCQQIVLDSGGADLDGPLLAIDRAIGKLVVVGHGDIRFEGTPTMLRCNLDGSACVAAPLPTPEHFLPKKIALGAELVLAGAFSAEAYVPDSWRYLVRCTLDGATCAPESAFPNQPLDTMPSVMEDGGDAVYVAGRGYDVIERDLVARHPHDSTPTTQWDATVGPGPLSLSDVILDAKNGKLITLTSAGEWPHPNGIVTRCELDGKACSAQLDAHATEILGFAGDYLVTGARRWWLPGGRWWQWFARCTGDGAACTDVGRALNDRAKALFLDDATSRAMMLDTDTKALVACDVQSATCAAAEGVSTSPRDRSLVTVSDGSLYSLTSLLDTVVLERCAVDGKTCARSDVFTRGDGRYLDGSRSLAVDEARGRVVIVVDDESRAHRPTLVVCDLDGKSCKAGEIANVAATKPRVMIHPTNGDVLVVAEVKQRPRLFTVTLP